MITDFGPVQTGMFADAVLGEAAFLPGVPVLSVVAPEADFVAATPLVGTTVPLSAPLAAGATGRLAPEAAGAATVAPTGAAAAPPTVAGVPASMVVGPGAAAEVPDAAATNSVWDKLFAQPLTSANAVNTVTAPRPRRTRDTRSMRNPSHRAWGEISGQNGPWWCPSR